MATVVDLAHAGIKYSVEPNLEPREFIEILQRSTLAERRPVDDLPTIRGMLDQADLIVTARNPSGLLVLLAAPNARRFYPHIGLMPHDSCWYINREQPATR